MDRRQGPDSNSDRRTRRDSRSRSRERSGNRRSRSRDRFRSRDNNKDRIRDRRGSSLEEDERDRDRNRDYRSSREYRGGGNSSINNSEGFNSPSSTVVFKGLPSHTTEPTIYAAVAAYGPKEIRLIASRGTGDCKGFAFVEFYSLEHAQYFMAAFAGSRGDPNAPQFIVENRAVVLEYARDGGGQNQGSVDRGEREPTSDRDSNRPAKCDWLCSGCGCQNFARRSECYRCSMPKNDMCTLINIDPYNDSAMVTDNPSAILVVRGLSPYVAEEQVTELFRQFALVKSTRIVRDQITGISKGICLVEFHSVEYATHTLNNSSHLTMEKGGKPLKIGYAKDSFVLATVTQQQMHAAQNAYATAALQAAQWSLGGAGAAVPASPSIGAPGSANITNMYIPIPLPPHSVPNQPPPRPSAAPPIAPSLPPHKGGSSSSSSSRPKVSLSLSAAQRVKPEWPSCFETHGASYTFQPQSGYFFEAISQFYYCPKSKLYYSTLEGIYYRYSVVLDPPFVPFYPPVPIEKYEDSEPVNISSTSGNNANQTVPVAENSSGMSASAVRKPVSMSFGLGLLGKSKTTKPLISSNLLSQTRFAVEDDADPQTEVAPLSESSSAQAVSAPASSSGSGFVLNESMMNVAPAVAKRINENVAKWDNRKKEMISESSDSTGGGREQLPTSQRVTEQPSQRTLNEDSQTNANPDSNASSAFGVAPASYVCLLCSRQFPSSEKLLRHEKESKLHAENLAKQQQEQSSQSQQYRDRASERRAIHGQSLPILNSEKDERFQDERDRDRGRRRINRSDQPPLSHPVASVSLPSTVYEDESNPGNQLLRKMGWSEGDGLGREKAGITVPVGVNEKQHRNNSGVGSNNSLYIPPIDYGDGYKESLVRAAKARYDHLQNEGSK